MIPLDAEHTARGYPVSRGYELTVVAPTFMESANIAAFVEGLRRTLGGVQWQVIFVDDASPDGTAEVAKALASADPRVSCLRRVGRRGLAGAVLEGALASAAPYVVVMDADGQHDASLIPAMLMRLRGGQTDLVVASRYTSGGQATLGFSRSRQSASRLATALARRLCGVELTDPMSGFFMARREVFDTAAGRVDPNGFKILFDLLATSGDRWRLEELSLIFQPRTAGESKLDRRVALDYLALLIARASHDLISPRALVFALVGASGLMVHLAVLRLALGRVHLDFVRADLLAALVAMGTNYLLNNELTYRDRRRRGWALLTGFPRFAAVCSLGLLVNIAVAMQVRAVVGGWWGAGAAGAAFAAVWNYTSATMLLC